MIFNWTNFQEQAEHLLGAGAEPQWIVESPLGKIQSYELHEAVGTGRMEFFEFKDRLSVFIFDCCWHEDKAFIVQDGSLVRFNFSLSLDMLMQLSANQEVQAISPSWRIINNPPDLKLRESVEANKKLTFVTICCPAEYLVELTGQKIENMPDLLRNAVSSEPDDSVYKLFEFTSRLNAITADIINNKFMDGLRLSYVFGRAVELLCLALNELIHTDDPISRVKLSGPDEIALEKAKSILLDSYKDPPTVSEISRLIGINRNKLFYGFKAQYSKTISDFIQEQRLEEGKRLLIETDLSIIEVAALVGFKHQCNFSTAMKRYFGLSPSQLR